MILAPYNENWAAEFAELEKILSTTLGSNILRIEHVGSTAIPGLCAKPILDIDVVIPGYDVFPAVVDLLNSLGYAHNGDQGIPGRQAFNRSDTSVPWTDPRRPWTEQHLYVCPADGAELRRHLKFRDALRLSPGLRMEYERMKLDLERRAAGDRKLYAAAKESECRDFVEGVLKMAI